MNSDPFSLDDMEPAAPRKTGDEAGPPPYLAGLNAAQLSAVEAMDGPVLVLAGAGTGKTRVLTTRLAHIINTGRAAPWNILAVTFTNKAAREMQERIAHTLGRPVEGMWIGTFHSLCARILRRHAELAGLNSSFTILDTDDQIRLLKQLIRAEGIDDKRWPPRQLAHMIDRWKNAARGPDHVAGDEAYAFANGNGQKLYAQYQERLKVLNAVDFGDLLLHVINLFQNHRDVLAQYHRQFRYILVDEYQDTNIAQYLWLRLLAQATGNICCVGDDDQSIYGWRGAEVGNILKFEKDFKGARVVRLEQNYRSTHHILGAASKLIATNEGRLGKTLWTESSEGEPVSVRGVWDAPEEARTVCEEIEQRQAQGHKLSEMAVLVRAGFQTREFEERLIHLGIPYRVVGGPRFYERAEIRDALAYLRVMVQPDDDLAFERIINVPKRGIGTTSVQKIHSAARTAHTSMTRAAHDLCDAGELRGKAQTQLAGLLEDFARWRSMATQENHADLAEIILDESGYTRMWQDDKSPDAPGRLENLKELVSAMREFETLGAFLEHISLVMENNDNGTDEKISVMTLHSAKGLEFDTVFLPGWEEGVFPNQKALDESGRSGLEEERRLAYVGLTRARRKALIFHAGNRQVFGQWQSSIPSRFIEELPEEHIEVEAAPGLYHGRGSNRFDYGDGDDVSYFTSDGRPYDQASDYDHTGRKAGYRPATPRWQHSSSGRDVSKSAKGRDIARLAKPVKTRASQNFAIGERVFHDKFGYGTIDDIEDDKVEVAFDKAGTKRLIDRFLTRAEDV